MKRNRPSDGWFFLARLFRLTRVTEPAGRSLEFTYTNVTADQHTVALDHRAGRGL
jgi:hypothetical protein